MKSLASTGEVKAVTADVTLGVLNASVVQRTDVTPDLTIWRIRPDTGRTPPFLPGQYVTIGAPLEPVRSGGQLSVPLVMRPYSIASPPTQREDFELFIRRVPEGSMTPRLWAASVGDRVSVGERPKGKLTLEAVPMESHLVMVSTGTGIAPFMAMLRAYATRGVWSRVTVINGVRSVADAAYHRELLTMQERDPTMSYVAAVSREPVAGKPSLAPGHVQTLLTPEAFKRLTGQGLTPSTCRVLLCGNPDMILAIVDALEPLGFSVDTSQEAGHIFFERYW
ncbi:MAG: ferredoxin--NADP reductase [Clostridia bacterium]|nr:ferredoxin--NADP reductase [Deltaproteobacteria bacterium]